MNLKQLMQEDDAVSPVIGVILMVAITVILAAVIASFVLGMGPDTATTPTATFSSEFEENTDDGSIAGAVTITMESGETLDSDDFTLQGDSLLDSDGNADPEDKSLSNLDGDFSAEELTAGTSFSVQVSDENYELSLIYTDGDTTSTMQTFEG